MTQADDAPAFDPKGQLRFDATTGSALDAANQRLLVVPCHALDDLLKASGRKASSTFGAAVGKACGARVASRLGGPEGVRRRGAETVLSHLAGELGVLGLGQVSIERWGRAMLFVVGGCAIADDACVAQVFEGALGAATGRDARCLVLARNADGARVLVASESGIERARALLASGSSWTDVVVKLQEVTS